MNKIEKALIELAGANVRIKEINTLISFELEKSAEAASDSDTWNPINKNKWLRLAYERGVDNPYEGSYFVNHDDDVEGFLGENCKHALQAHKLIQERKELRKVLGTAKRRVTFLANRLYKAAA